MSKTRTVMVCAIVAFAWTTLSDNALAQPEPPEVVRVDGSVSNPNPPGQGDDWGEDHAYKYVQDGIQRAEELLGNPEVDLVQVWVAATEGPYRPTETTDRTISFQLRDKVELYGGFAGDETTLSQRNIFMNKTVLSGDLNGDDQAGFVNREDNSYRVVRSLSNASTAQIDGFIITAGNSDNQGPGAPSPSGGGMYAAQSAAAVINCTFTSNSAGWLHTEWPFDSIPGWGGAVYTSTDLSVIIHHNSGQSPISPTMTAC